MSGYHTLKAWLNGMQSLGGSKEGKAVLKFKDGGQYTFENPEMSIEGIMKTNKVQVYYKKGRIIDTVNGLEGEIVYNPNFNAGVSGIGYRYTVGWLPGMNTLGQNKKQQRPARADDIDIKIFDKNKKVVCEGYGSRLSHLILGEKVFWRIEDECPKWNDYGVLSDGLKVLESDTRNRKDVMPMINENWQEAEKSKLELEELQRKDKKLRTAFQNKKK